MPGWETGLDADADGAGLLRAEADFLEVLRVLLLQELDDGEGGFAAGFKVDARVDVLGVFAEDDHVDLLGRLDRGGDAGEVLDGAQADVEVEHLAQGDVEGADAAADGCGERALDADEIFLEGLDGVVGEPVVELGFGRLAREDLEPGDFLGAAVGFFHRRVHDAHAGGPDVAPGAVAADEGDDRIIGDGEDAVFDGDFAASGGSDVLVSHRESRIEARDSGGGKKIVR